jgi:hypothetical protein
MGFFNNLKTKLNTLKTNYNWNQVFLIRYDFETFIVYFYYAQRFGIA